MSSTPATSHAVVAISDEHERRVRHQARDAAALMVFSLAVSVACATAFLLLAHLGR
ncbi:MAG: hypothetical protein WB767_00730 [Nocardioides sp.]